MRISECRAHEFWNIGLTTTAIKGLVSFGYETLDDLRRADDCDLLKIRGLGIVSVMRIRDYTNTRGVKERVRIDVLNNKKEALLLEIDKIDKELEQLYKALED